MSLKAEQDADGDAHRGRSPAGGRGGTGRFSRGRSSFSRPGWGGMWGTSTATRTGRYGKTSLPPLCPAEAADSARPRAGRPRDRDRYDEASTGAQSSKFEVHHVVLKAGRYALENVTHIEDPPATGFGVIVAPIKIETGSGGPTRIWATVTK